MHYVLLHPLLEEDFDFLNETNIKTNIFNSFKPDVGSDNSVADSGWCDMVSGARLIGRHDNVVFMPTSDEERTLLVLKFGNRLIPSDLHQVNKLTT